MLTFGEIKVGENEALDYEVNYDEVPNKEMGIDGGRITTLIIMRGDDWLYSYLDGQEDVGHPDEQSKEALKALLQAFN